MNLNNYADVLISALKNARAGKFKKGDNILVSYDAPALALAETIYAKLLKVGFNVVVRPYQSENMARTFFTTASKAQLTFQAPWEKCLNENLHGLIALRAPENLENLKNVDPKNIALASLARKPIREILDVREQKGLFGWTLANVPTQGMARQAGLTIKEYENQVIKACFLDAKNPAKKFMEVSSQIAEIAARLSALPIKTLRLQSDLEILLGESRKFIAARGCNVPSFEIFTSPDWRGTRGVYFSDLTSFRNGTYVKGVNLEFKNGRVIKATAKQGGDFLKKMISLDKGAAQIGEFSLTDRRFSRINKFMADTLFDENFGGNFGNSHIALGASFADTFTGNQAKLNKALKQKLGFNDSALHWDLVNTEDKLVTATLKNGKHLTIYESGIFLI